MAELKETQLKEMHRNHVVLWDGLSETGERKWDSSIWKHNGGYIDIRLVKDGCFCCQWVIDNHGYVTMGTCKHCPLDLGCGDKDSLYNRWTHSQLAGNLEKSKELAAEIRDLPLVVNEKTYHIGQRFTYVEEHEYILAQADEYEVALINLTSGNRFNDSIEVRNVDKITEEEFNRISNDSFTLKE